MANPPVDLAQLRRELRGYYVTSASPGGLSGDGVYTCFQGTYLEAWLESSEANMKHQHIWRAFRDEGWDVMRGRYYMPVSNIMLYYESTIGDFLKKGRKAMMIGYSCVRWALLNRPPESHLALNLLRQVQPELFLERLKFECDDDMVRFVLGAPYQLPIAKDDLDDLLDSTKDPDLRAKLLAMGATEMAESPPMTPEVPAIDEDLFDYEYLEYCWRNEFREDQKLSTKHVKRLAGCACFFCRECTFV